MIKYNIYSKDNNFALDISNQIKRFIADVEITNGQPNSDTNLVLIDENEDLLKEYSKIYKEIPIIYFSSKTEASEKADVVIKKPFKLHAFLSDLKNDTLLPKVRRKECLIFNEYNLYPVKKEIYSSATKKITKLTEKEIDILKYLYQIMPDSATKEDLLENVWGYSAEATTHTVETHIYRLRQKVEKNGESQLIVTENNGYRINV